MRALEKDLIVFYQLIAFVEQYADMINSEAQRRNMYGIANRISKVTGACSSFCMNFRSSLSRENVEQLTEILSEDHVVDSLDLFLGFMTLMQQERDQMRVILQSILESQKVTVTTE